jgi:prefoldin subunit 5
MSDEKPKPSIDERLDRLAERHEALAQSVESLTHDIHEMQASLAKAQAIIIESDRRERQARRAMLRGIEAYLRALDDGGQESPDLPA